MLRFGWVYYESLKFLYLYFKKDIKCVNFRFKWLFRDFKRIPLVILIILLEKRLIITIVKDLKVKVLLWMWKKLDIES